MRNKGKVFINIKFKTETNFIPRRHTTQESTIFESMTWYLFSDYLECVRVQMKHQKALAHIACAIMAKCLS